MQTVSRLITTFAPTHYDLSLTLNRQARTFDGIVTIIGASTSSEITLHAKDLTITRTHIDGKSVSHSINGDELTLQADNAEPGKHTVLVEFSGVITDAMHGLYPCYFTHDSEKKELLATQFESHHAREVFPCVDEPEAKATFDLTLTTEKNVEVLANMPIKLQREENDALVTTFETTPRMSSYLLAWVVGELHKRTAHSKSGVEVNVWATHTQSSESLDFALDIAARTIDFYDEYFGVAYPLPKSDHVALPDFSSGAMENWGLITYREVALIVDPKSTSVSMKHYVATVIAHELAHQWFGNLVTMKWWNDLWLNESFATLMEYIAVDALHPEWDIWLDFASSETIMALRRDAIDGVQAVQVDVHHPDEISTLFDGAIVYAKGARLLRMLETYIGKDAFRAGLRDYFNIHAYKNTSANDLWNSLSRASDKDVASFMTAWISQSGYPVVTFDDETVTTEQFFIGDHEPSTKSWPIPLGASDPSLPTLLEEALITTSSPLSTRLNTSDSAHFITKYSDTRLEAILGSITTASPLSRLQLMHEQSLLARGGKLASAALIPLLETYREETTESVWDIMALTFGELKKFVETDSEAEAKLRTFAHSLARNQFETLGWDEVEGEPETHTKLRATILALMLYSEDEAVTSEALRRFHASTLEDLPSETRSLYISTAIKYEESPELVQHLLDTYASTPSVDLKQDICAGITSTRSAETALKLLDLSKDQSVIKNQDAFRWYVYLVRNRYARETAWQWVQDNWSWVKQTFGGDKSYDDYPRYAASGLVTRTQLEEYREFFGPMKSEPALTRTITLGIAEIEARIGILERDTDAVLSSLKQL